MLQAAGGGQLPATTRGIPSSRGIGRLPRLEEDRVDTLLIMLSVVSRVVAGSLLAPPAAEATGPAALAAPTAAETSPSKSKPGQMARVRCTRPSAVWL